MTRDLLHGEDVKALVREAYGAVDGGTRAVAEQLYSAEELELVPESAIDRALGVANHLRHAAIAPDDVVLDLGCGGGIDTILAARRASLVIGLDFVPAMLERTKTAAAEAGLSNVEVLEGEMEAIPLEDESVDHVISNGVINLSARKSRVLAVCARVLRAGGGLTVSDLTVEDEELPPEILTHPATWAG